MPPPAPTYGGPMPPGGWQQPLQTQQAPGVAGHALATWGSRAAATLIDGAILLIPFLLVLVAVVAILGVGGEASAIVTFLVGVLAFLVVALFYAPILMARGGARNGQTFGKQIMNIRVVRINGEPFGFLTAAVREVGVKVVLAGILNSIAFGLPIATLLDFLWPLWDDENRALHDMIVSSRVVTE